MTAQRLTAFSAVLSLFLASSAHADGDQSKGTVIVPIPVKPAEPTFCEKVAKCPKPPAKKRKKAAPKPVPACNCPAGEPGPKGDPGVTRIIHETRVVHVYQPAPKSNYPFNIGAGWLVTGFGLDDHRNHGAAQGPMLQLKFDMHERAELVLGVAFPNILDDASWSPWKEKGFVVNLGVTTYLFDKAPWLGLTFLGIQFQGIGFERGKEDGFYAFYAPGVTARFPLWKTVVRAEIAPIFGGANFGDGYNYVMGGTANLTFSPNWKAIFGKKGK